MNNVVIRIIDNTNNVLGDLDLSNFTDFPFTINLGIVNLDNLKARTGTYSKTFKVPNTKNNADLLSNVENINSRKDYRDALNRKSCSVIINDSEVDTGFIQVSKVFNGFEVDSFELVFFGNNIDWVKQASELKINTINWVGVNQVYSKSNINTVNAGDSDTYDIAYPYISRGGNQVPSDTEVIDFKPVFYLKSIINRGLNDLGYKVSSTFLQDINIEKLVCDFPLKFKSTDEDVKDTDVFVNRSQPALVIAADTFFRLNYNIDTSPYFDNGNNYDTVNSEYIVPENGTYNLNPSFKVNLTAGVFVGIDLDILVVVNGDSATSIGSGTIIDTIQTSVSTLSGAPIQFTNNYIFTTGDKVSIYISPKAAGGGTPYTFTLLDGNTFGMVKLTNIGEGDIFSLNNVLPDKYTLLDIINDFTRMFNIYYWTDIKTKTIYLEPRDTFFKSKTSAINWGDKLDLSNKFEVNYISKYKRNIKFGYKELNNDDWLKGWQDENKRVYADYNHVLPDRFTEGTDELKLDTFSAAYGERANEVTPLDNGVFVDSESIVTIREWAEYIDTQPADRIDNYNPKIYFFNNGGQTNIDSTNRKINIFGTSKTTIPYGIFETYDNTVSPKNLSFTGDDGLFASHYSNMFKNLEEGGRLIAYFDLSSTDISNLDFRSIIYIDRPSNITGYYFIENVIDYNPIQNGLTKVSLFKFEDLGSVPIDNSQQGNNDSIIDNGNTTPTSQGIFIEGASNLLIQVWTEDPITGIIEPVNV